jgi:CrcB protein
MIALLSVFAAGAAGATCRYLLDGAVQERWDGAFPMGTFVVNVLGSFGLGLIVGIADGHTRFPDELTVGGGVGFLGAFTTFSTLSWESLRLLREGSSRYATMNLLGSTLAGLASAAAGLFLGSLP